MELTEIYEKLREDRGLTHEQAHWLAIWTYQLIESNFTKEMAINNPNCSSIIEYAFCDYFRNKTNDILKKDEYFLGGCLYSILLHVIEREFQNISCEVKFLMGGRDEWDGD